MELSQPEQNAILERINYFYVELLGKYEEEKYDEQEYMRLCTVFKSPSLVKGADIEAALAWKYGKTKDNVLKNKNYDAIVNSLKNNLPIYLRSGVESADGAFSFLTGKIDSSFVTVAFIAHLMFPTEMPIVDRHTFRAVRYFLDFVGYRHGIKKQPNSLGEIHALRDFVNQFSKLKNVTKREFDKYLMMFGKHVAPN